MTDYGKYRLSLPVETQIDMKRSIHIILALMLSASASAQNVGQFLGALLGAVASEVGTASGDSESITGIPQQNLADWGITPANYSGITPLGNGRYAVVSDKGDSDGFHVWKIEQDPQSGAVTQVVNEGFKANRVDATANRDCEGIVYVPKYDCLFISGEGDQRIIGYDMDGQRNGLELMVPEQFRSTVSNQGLEALGFGGKGGKARLWSTTETSLPADGQAAGPKAPGAENLLRLQSFKTNLKPSKQFAYKMDAGRSSDFGSTYVFGVPEVCALPDGRVLVLEREANIPAIYVGAEVICKLYCIKPKSARKISCDTVLSELSDDRFLKKELIANWSTTLSVTSFKWANYEGMCLGARLSDGRQTLLLISDSQGGYGKGPIRLQDYIKVIYL